MLRHREVNDVLARKILPRSRSPGPV